LMYIAGYYGGFTYSVRGGVFCNAQTANFVLFAMALGNSQWRHALYFLIPMSAYLMGAIISEAIAGPIKKMIYIRWDTMLILIEIAAVFFLGLLPESAPYEISQVTINFICSMQYNTFRQAQSVPMATTFCTNHLRQTGIAIAKTIRHPEQSGSRKRLLIHVCMLTSFVAGGFTATKLSHVYLGRSIWAAGIPLAIIFFDLLSSDLKADEKALSRVPRGH